MRAWSTSPRWRMATTSTNGYYGRDWTGVGISPKFDFIIIHESGHEWFGNAITCGRSFSDMWIHEGWTTYMEALYVEYRWGKADATSLREWAEAEGDRTSGRSFRARGTNAEPPQDQYFKGALMLNTLRSVIDRRCEVVRGYPRLLSARSSIRNRS